MNMDEVEGTARNVAGKAQKAFGDVTGDTNTQLGGVARQVAGRAQDAYGDARDVAEDAARQVGRLVGEQPVLALLAAGAIGYALGLLTGSAMDRRSSWRRW